MTDSRITCRSDRKLCFTWSTEELCLVYPDKILSPKRVVGIESNPQILLKEQAKLVSLLALF